MSTETIGGIMRGATACWLGLLVGAIFGCGPSAAEVRRARSAIYQTDLDVVWQAASTELKDRYKTLRVADRDARRLVTEWYRVQITQVDPERSTASSGDARGGSPVNDPPVGGGQGASPAGDFRAAIFFRMAVQIEGGPPWKILVDGEAAEYRPGLAVLTPYRHGVPDEPPWVQPRIDELRCALYDRLKGYAVATTP